jgi:hypothetical protein
MSILEGASSPEDGANWTPPTLGRFVETSNRRLRETAAYNTMLRESIRFFERKAMQHGLDSNRGLAYFREANRYREGRLQEPPQGQPGAPIPNSGGGVPPTPDDDQQGPPPKSMAKVHKAAAQFHKKQAEKVGIDTNTGQAHFAAMNHHINQYKQAKAAHKASQPPKEPQGEAAFGHSGKQSPVPVPAKSQQPSEDIRQDKPAVPLKKLQQTPGAHAGIMKASAEGGPGSGPRSRSGKLTRKQNLKKAMDELAQHQARHGYHNLSLRIERDRGKKKEAGNQMVAQRYDKSHPEGFESPEYAGLKKMPEANEGGPGSGPRPTGVSKTSLGKHKSLVKRGFKHSVREDPFRVGTKVHFYKKGRRYETLPKQESEHRQPGAKPWPIRQKQMHRQMGKAIDKGVLESRRFDDDEGPSQITLDYRPPERHDGWVGQSYSPPVTRLREGTSSNGVVIKEF